MALGRALVVCTTSVPCTGECGGVITVSTDGYLCYAQTEAEGMIGGAGVVEVEADGTMHVACGARRAPSAAGCTGLVTITVAMRTKQGTWATAPRSWDEYALRPVEVSR